MKQLTCILALIPFFAFPQAEKIDSLKRLIDTEKQDTALVNHYLDIGRLYENNAPDTAAFYFLKARDISLELNYVEGICGYATSYGYLLSIEGKYDSAIVINLQALEAALEADNQKQAAKARTGVGAAFHYKGDYRTALNYYLEALDYFEKINSTKEIILIYDCLQDIYYQMIQCDKGAEYGEKALALLDKTPNPHQRISVLINLANNYMEMVPPRYNDAYPLLIEALELCKQLNDLYREAIAEGNISNLFLLDPKRRDLNEMEKHILRAHELHVRYGDISGVCTTYRGMAYIEFEHHNFAKSREWLLKCLELAKENEFLNEEMKAYNALSHTELAMGNYQKFREYNLAYDSVATLTVNSYLIEATRDLEVKYETGKKQLEIERQQREIERHNTERLLFIVGLALFILFLALLAYLLAMRIRHNRTLTERNDALAQRNDALSEMNATKDKFFSIISHDLKNPAIAMRDALKLLFNNGSKWDAATRDEFYSELLHSADSQVELLYNLLRWAQMQTGRMEYRPIEFDLVARLRSELTLIRNIADNKGIAFNTEMPDEAVVTADPNMLATVVRNLLSNAVKFTKQGGNVNLAIEQYRTGEDATVTTQVTVTDSGVGMTTEQIADIFRIDSHSSRQGTAGEQGTGLGLIVCHDMLAKHGSVLHIDSQPDVGSRFRFQVSGLECGFPTR